MRFSPNGRMLALIRQTPGGTVPAHLELWDLSTGELAHRHVLPASNQLKLTDWLPDNSTLVIDFEGMRFLVDANSGKVTTHLPESPFAISNDARLLAGLDLPSDGDRRIPLFEVGSGLILRQFRIGGVEPVRFGLSPSRRAIIIARGASLIIADLVTGKERGRLGMADPADSRGQDAQALKELRVLPGDRRAMTLHEDGTILIWDLTLFPDGLLTESHGERELSQWWDELAAADSGKAHEAIWKLIESPAESVTALLRKRIRRSMEIDLEGPRIHLPGLQGPLPSPEHLRTLRSISVLERIETTEAATLLWEIAGGNADHSVTRLARDSLARIMKSASWTTRR